MLEEDIHHSSEILSNKADRILEEGQILATFPLNC